MGCGGGDSEELNTEEQKRILDYTLLGIVRANIVGVFGPKQADTIEAKVDMFINLIQKDIVLLAANLNVDIDIAQFITESRDNLISILPNDLDEEQLDKVTYSIWSILKTLFMANIG